jgi:hypothetical protein
MIKKSRFSTHHISSGTQIQKIGKPNNLKSLGAGRPKGLNMILPESGTRDALLDP